MAAWLDSLNHLEYFLLLLAVPATLIMVLQTILLLFGMHNSSDGDADADVDTDGGWDVDHDCGCGLDHDADFDHDVCLGHALDADHDADCVSAGHEGGGEGLFAGLRLFTIRGIIAFLAIFGWGGLWLLRIGVNVVLALFLAVAMGVWAMVLVALLLRLALKLQADGTVEPRNALGLSGTVYLTIPAARTGEGKVNVLVQERLTEFEAVTDDPQSLPTGSEITVVGLSGQNTLVVTHK